MSQDGFCLGTLFSQSVNGESDRGIEFFGGRGIIENMAQRLILEFVTLSIFSFLMGITFCDFYRLHTARKLIWFCIFLAISAYVLRTRGEFDLALILPIPILLAIGLAWLQKKK